jgi:ankyrin repeat protein
VKAACCPCKEALNRKNVAASSALIEAHANGDERFDFDSAALRLACRQDLPTVIEQLLQAIAKVHASDTEGDFPLHVAAAYGSVAGVCVYCLRLQRMSALRTCILQHRSRHLSTQARHLMLSLF